MFIIFCLILSFLFDSDAIKYTLTSLILLMSKQRQNILEYTQFSFSDFTFYIVTIICGNLVCEIIKVAGHTQNATIV